MPVDTVPQFHEPLHILTVLLPLQPEWMGCDVLRPVRLDSLGKATYADGKRQRGAVSCRARIVRAKLDELDPLNDSEYRRNILGGDSGFYRSGLILGTNFLAHASVPIHGQPPGRKV